MRGSAEQIVIGERYPRNFFGTEPKTGNLVTLLQERNVLGASEIRASLSRERIFERVEEAVAVGFFSRDILQLFSGRDTCRV